MKYLHGIAALFCLLGLTALAAPAEAGCTYRVTGRLKVRPDMTAVADQLGSPASLKNVKVRVQGRTKVTFAWGPWNAWSTTAHTTSSGYFSITKSKSCNDKRRLRVQVKFDDSDLEIRHEHATNSTNKVKWYTIYEETSGYHKGATTVSLGDLVFEKGGSRALGDFEPRQHAEIWALYKHIVALMKTYGSSSLAFQQQIKVKYPHDGIAGDSVELSYANPLNNVIYIVKNSQHDAGDRLHTLVHELGHIWMYQHSTGEDAMATYLATHLKRGTHDITDQSYVAYHEGAAEFWKDMVLLDGFGVTPSKIRSRAGIGRDTGADTFHDVEHVDLGWESIFRLLLVDNLWTLDARTTDRFLGDTHPFVPYRICSAPQLSFEDFLRIQQGHSGFGQIGTSDMNFADFFSRAAALTSGLEVSDKTIYKKYVNVASSADPYDDMCRSTLVAL